MLLLTSRISCYQGIGLLASTKEPKDALNPLIDLAAEGKSFWATNGPGCRVSQTMTYFGYVMSQCGICCTATSRKNMGHLGYIWKNEEET